MLMIHKITFVTIDSTLFRTIGLLTLSKAAFYIVRSRPMIPFDRFLVSAYYAASAGWTQREKTLVYTTSKTIYGILALELTVTMGVYQ